MRTKEELLVIIKDFEAGYKKDTDQFANKIIIGKILEDMCEVRSRAIINRRLSHLRDNDFFALTALYTANATIQKKTNT